MSRPTKLTDATLKAAEAYVDGDWREGRRAIPMIEGLALLLDIDRETVRAWANDPVVQNKTETAKHFADRKAKHAKFSGIVKRLNAIQALELADGALRNKLNARTANMMLSRHGYVERKETDITTKDQPISLLAGLAPSKLVVEDEDAGDTQTDNSAAKD